MARLVSDAGVGCKDVDGPEVGNCFLYALGYRCFIRDVACNVEEIRVRCILVGSWSEIMSRNFAAASFFFEC